MHQTLFFAVHETDKLKFSVTFNHRLLIKFLHPLTTLRKPNFNFKLLCGECSVDAITPSQIFLSQCKT